jgi:hypothetical protein
MIIEEVTKSVEKVPPKTIKTPTPLQSKSLNSIAGLFDISSPLLEKTIQATSSKVEDPLSFYSKKGSKLSTHSTTTKMVVSSIPPIKPGNTSNTNLESLSTTASSSLVKTENATKLFVAPLTNLGSSFRSSSISLPGPSTSHCPWTPQRLLSDTPQKVENSPLQIKPSPNRGVKRLLQVCGFTVAKNTNFYYKLLPFVMFLF